MPINPSSVYKTESNIQKILKADLSQSKLLVEEDLSYLETICNTGLGKELEFEYPVEIGRAIDSLGNGTHAEVIFRVSPQLL